MGTPRPVILTYNIGKYNGQIAFLYICRFFPSGNCRQVFRKTVKKPASCDTGLLRMMFSYACQALHTSTQAVNPEYFSISGIVSSMAELLLPAAGKTVSNRWMEMSR